ncbi:MAG TPA: DNA replication/repair protein RecF, partial [Paracoccaceae bacterium]|nr:DNA replication/repair protein RecF [Paracoccaceae bacterium]
MQARLAILTLTLSRFRSYAQAAIETEGRPLALFGPNGAGKTNLLEAISLFSPGRGLRRAEAAELARRPGPPGWKISATIDSPTGAHQLATWSEADGTRQVEIDGKPAPQLALARLARILWLTPAMDRLWAEGAADRRRFLDRVTMSFHPGHAEATIAYEKAMRERNRLLKDQVRDPAWHGALEAQMARAGFAILRNRSDAVARLMQAQERAATAFPRAGLALAEPEDAAPPASAEALRAALAGGRARDLSAGRTLTGPHRTDLVATYAAMGTEARLCSTGEQKALLISLVLANARALARDFGAPPILLLDEVAAHLDAGRRAALYEELAALGAQSWLTGTGPELFADLGPSALRFAVADGT